MKTKPIAVIILSALLCFCSCNNRQYRDDVRCAELASLAVASSAKEFAAYDDGYLEYLIRDTSLCDDSHIIYTVEVNDIDELGVIHAKSESDAEKVYEMTKAYITDLRQEQRAFISSYAPKELPKLDNARVERFGCYVVYSISDKETANKNISAIADALA